jgi:hypothetical protein
MIVIGIEPGDFPVLDGCDGGTMRRAQSTITMNVAR